MGVLTEDSARSGAQDRLGALRAAQPVEQRKVRTEVLVGAVLLAVGIVVVLFLRGGQGDVLVAPTAQVQSAEPARPMNQPVLLADDALVALSLEAGHFPPDLAPGDAVMVTIRTDDDFSAESRSLDQEPTVVSVDAPSNGELRWIVVVKAKKSLPRALISARDVSLSIVSGVGK